ncbi:serine protease HTRA2, mitochondrial-like [Lineus longissimus]|uniref:serine protease HTRA2, mitochondrial-like n=1 Tax=Lineus longissimus TaxID=88925 RepID=UPI00315C528F
MSRFLRHLVSSEVLAAEPVDDDTSLPPSKRLNFIADVVEKAAPSVCYLEIRGPHPLSRQMTTLSNGSGFIIREDGLILTNAHVVAPKQKHNLKLTVVLGDGRKFDGVIQAFDPVTDLATIKIKASGLPVLKLASSSNIRPGEWVVAMGSPLSLSNTVTCGIVSSINRGSKELGIQNKDMEYIQTDAVINFGNSGGPLVNLDGEAIGINTMKVTTGISFAIPSDYAKQFLDKAEILEKRIAARGSGWFGSSKPAEPKRRYMGVTMLTLTPSIVSELRMRMTFPSVESGVLVHKVVVGSPAYHGGVRPGDVIVKVNGNPVKSATDIYKAVESSQDLDLTVHRGDATVNLTVEPEDVE